MVGMAYPTDLTDEQWTRIEPLIPAAEPGGRPRSVNMREVVNAILYLIRTGCSWRLLPHDFPPWGTVHFYYRQVRLGKRGTATFYALFWVKPGEEKVDSHRLCAVLGEAR